MWKNPMVELPRENEYCIIVELIGRKGDTIRVRQISALFKNKAEGFRLNNYKTYIPVRNVLRWMLHCVYPEF